MKKFRKFCFSTIQAGMSFAFADRYEYAVNCFKNVHLYVQMQNGWYDTKYLVYSNLGAHQLDFVSP
jgi:hypothetical protein